MRLSVPLSQLVSDRRNPRRVKPERDAHRRLVASIRAHGLLEPLVVRPVGDDRYRVIAGRRRLDALRDVHRGQSADPPIACEVHEVDDDTARALALAENFAREGMHPLDEAEAFARLASVECKGVEAIASEFGVTAHYVRQRMKLASLCDVVQASYRAGEIDTATAEAFAAVPPERQVAVWDEVGGRPRHAEHVRHLIAHAWVDAEHARFDINELPDAAVSRDLFGERVLIERRAFMLLQAEALTQERESLLEAGWQEVVVASRVDVQDRLYAMVAADPEYDDTTGQLDAIEDEREAIESAFDELDADDESGIDELQAKLDALDERQEAIIAQATPCFSEATKAVGTVFLLLDPDGRVHREYRLPRSRPQAGSRAGEESGDEALPSQAPVVPTPVDLADRQLATTFTHEALAVRGALLDSPRHRLILLVMALHPKVRHEALAVRTQTCGSDLHADHTEGFVSPALAAIRNETQAIDPLQDRHSVDDVEAYDVLRALPDAQLERLVDLLLVSLVNAHPTRETSLVRRLAGELTVNIRTVWRPDASWLSAYRKCQLAHLLGDLRGPAHGSAAERRKKSELVAELDELFRVAAESGLEDPLLAERLNAWLPANMEVQAEAIEPAAVS